MVRVVLDIRKSVEENAAAYFEKAKKARKKLEGVDKTIALAKERLLEKERAATQQQRTFRREWYHAFRWFYSSDGFLVLAGKDADTNERLVKKQLEKQDIIFHTDMPGSPFVLVKKGQSAPEQTIAEASSFTASLSRAWKKELGEAEVYWVLPDQVTKETKAGEYITKGSFMVYGKRNYVTAPMDLAIGVSEKWGVMLGPMVAVKRHCSREVQLKQSADVPGQLARKIARFLHVEIDAVSKVLPANARADL
ncbi:MAG: NFACT RNA binding domain-containing protein [archaeon]